MESADAAPGLTPGGAWEKGVASKLVSLASARMVAQVLGLAWFLYAARAFDPRDFGILSTGLVLVVVIGGLSDLGTTRTVVRHVAAEPTGLRSNFLRAAGLRAAAGLSIGVVAVILTPLVQDDVPIGVVLVAALIAVASGVTEIGFAALRAVGLVGAEVGMLVGERLLFVAAGTAVVLTGHGPLAVLIAYAATNTVSATVVGVRAIRWPGGHGTSAGPMLDAEGRHTAISSTLVIVGPRVSALLLVIMSVPVLVGSFTIAQKVPEALGALGVAVLMPVLPMVRVAVVDGRGRVAIARAGRVTAAVTAAVLPAVIFLAIDGGRVLDLLFGIDDRPGSVMALRFLAVAAVVWIVRTFGELVLLAQERAARYVVAVAIAVTINVVVAVVLIPLHGAAGAAAASLLAELVVFGLVFVALRGSVGRTVWRGFVPAALFGVAAIVSSIGARGWPLVVGVVLTAIWSAAGLAVTGLPLRDRSVSLDLPGSGAGSDDSNVGQEVSRDLIGNAIESVEYLSAPTDHL